MLPAVGEVWRVFCPGDGVAWRRPHLVLQLLPKDRVRMLNLESGTVRTMARAHWELLNTNGWVGERLA